VKQMLPNFCDSGDDQQYGSSAVADIAMLQALSKRIHHGLFVAESKFRQSPETFRPLIEAKDEDGLMAAITNAAVVSGWLAWHHLLQEDNVVQRVLVKAKTYGQDLSPSGAAPAEPIRHSVSAELLSKWFRDIVMPMTKKVQVLYLLGRLKTNTDQ